MPPGLVPATFSCAPVGGQLSRRIGPYQGYAQDGSLDRPLFSFEEARLIVEGWKALPVPDGRAPEGSRYDAHFNTRDRTFKFYDPTKDVWHVWEGEAVGVATLYPIGEGAWKWKCRS